MESEEIEPILNEIIWLTEYAKRKKINAECYSVNRKGLNKVILIDKQVLLEKAYSEKHMAMKIDVRAANKTKIESKEKDNAN